LVGGIGRRYKRKKLGVRGCWRKNKIKGEAWKKKKQKKKKLGIKKKRFQSEFLKTDQAIDPLEDSFIPSMKSQNRIWMVH
jgi:hypothetical protein